MYFLLEFEHFKITENMHLLIKGSGYVQHYKDWKHFFVLCGRFSNCQDHSSDKGLTIEGLENALRDGMILGLGLSVSRFCSKIREERDRPITSNNWKSWKLLEKYWYLHEGRWSEQNVERWMITSFTMLSSAIMFKDNLIGFELCV